MSNTKIEWSEYTWNPITGCDKVSSGCKNCYAERMAKRLKAMKNRRYVNGFDVTIHEDLFNVPLKLRQPKLIFVCSMSDLFHEDIPAETIYKLFDIMEKASIHTFQVLTKRAERLQLLFDDRQIPDNIWVGISIENDSVLNRIEHLNAINANTKFVSFEPLLGSVKDIDLSDVAWAIVGGESGPHSRPMKEQWVLEVLQKCQESETLFYFKQWGGFNKKKNGRILNGRIYDNMPQR